MQRLLNATLVMALVGLVASPASAQVVGVDGIDARDGAPAGIQHVRQWTYVETRRCTITRHNGQVQRVCRVERRGQQPSWLIDRGDAIPPALRPDEIPSPEVGTPANPRTSKPSIKLPRRDGKPSLELPRRDGAPAIVLPRRHMSPPLAQLPAPYRPRAASRPTAKAPQQQAVPVAPKATPAPAAKPRVAVATLTKLEAQAFTLLNAERKRQGKSALRIDPRAVAVARAHSKDMCVRGYFDHRSPEGSAPWDRLRAGKVRFSGAGENIAVGYTTAAGVHRGWMNSPGHRKNRMNGSYTRTGIGMYACNGKPYWTEVFMK